jgi:hypothetical protein
MLSSVRANSGRKTIDHRQIRMIACHSRYAKSREYGLASGHRKSGNGVATVVTLVGVLSSGEDRRKPLLPSPGI